MSQSASPGGTAGQPSQTAGDSGPGQRAGVSPNHSAAVERFTAHQRELPKDSVPLRRGQTMDRREMISQFQQRVRSQSGGRDKFGFAHTEAVVNQQREMRAHNSAVKRFAPAKSAPSNTPTRAHGHSMGMG